VYRQKDTARRTLKDVPEADRLESYNSQNIDFVIEDMEAVVLVDDVLFEVPTKP
jgi:hypothetical protein